VIEAIGGYTNITDSISIDGGLTRSTYLCKFLADILGWGIIRRDVTLLAT
jgi:glycerol kinase